MPLEVVTSFRGAAGILIVWTRGGGTSRGRKKILQLGARLDRLIHFTRMALLGGA